MLGIDISKWNSVFDWSKVQKQGVELAYLKASGAGNGGNYIDFRFKENGTSCPLPYKGAYHYFDYRGHGADQCKYFLDTVGDFGNLRGALDFEDNSGGGWPKLSSMVGTSLKEALAWVTQYKLECGHYPVLYMSTDPTTWKQWTSTGYKYTFRNFTDCPLWVANYNKITTPPTGAWSTYTMWQYTSNGDGYLFGNGGTGNPYIDLNIVKDVNALLKPGVTIEDPVVIPVIQPTDAEKLRILWEAYKAYNK